MKAELVSSWDNVPDFKDTHGTEDSTQHLIKNYNKNVEKI